MEKEVTITRTTLAAALQKWDEEAKANNWPDRPNAYQDNADYLITLLDQQQALS